MKNYKLAVTTLLVLLVVSAAGSLLSIAYGSLLGLSRQNRLNRFAAFALQEKEFQKLNEQYQDWKKLPEELRRFRRDFIISMDDFAVFRRDLNSCLADNHFHAANITFQFGGRQNKIRKVNIGFVLQGTYRDLKKFIFDMERKTKMHFFTRIELNGAAEMVNGNFSMEAYIGE